MYKSYTIYTLCRRIYRALNENDVRISMNGGGGGSRIPEKLNLKRKFRNYLQITVLFIAIYYTQLYNGIRWMFYFCINVQLGNSWKIYTRAREHELRSPGGTRRRRIQCAYIRIRINEGERKRWKSRVEEIACCAICKLYDYECVCVWKLIGVKETHTHASV